MSILRDNGRWDDKFCDTQLPFICSMDKSPEFGTDGVPNLFNCPAGYHPIGSACYKFSVNKLSYNDAKTACAADKGSFKYGGLATAWDGHDNAFMYAMMNEIENPVMDPAWFGLYYNRDLHQESTSTTWLWEDKLELKISFLSVRKSKLR